MGALIQVLLPDATLAATALTDPHGRYKLTDLPPGNYQVRATAALFLPAVRSHLQVARGSHAVVNLTLATLLSGAQWLPATRRTAGESGDDWAWTLRSSANRPILRLVEEENSGTGAVVFSSSATERRTAPSQGRVTLIDSEGGFGRGGAHDVLVLSSGGSDGSASILSADFSGPRSPYPVNPSADISVGLQRSFGFGGISRSVLSYTSHPELASANTVGLQGAVLRNGQRLELGDSVRVDAGSVITDLNMGGNLVSVEPFLHVSVRPLNDLQVTYGFTSARGTEVLDDLDHVQIATPVAVSAGGKLHTLKGHHQALSVSTRLPGKGTVELAGYRDVLMNEQINGSGTLLEADLAAGGVISDPTTQSFKAETRGYSSTGIRIFVSEPLTPALSVSGQLTSGEALAADTTIPQSLLRTLTSAHPKHTYAALVAADGKILKSGTNLHASYRWQPEETLTAVDPYHSGLEGAYLSFILRQPLRVARVLPNGFEAVVDVSNLLAQGYQPFLSKDGRTLFLAESPRVLQAGISFNF